MTIDSTAPRTRRAMLVGGIGGLAAIVANAVARPAAALASDGQAMVVGGEYSSASVTAVTNATGIGLSGTSLGSGFGVSGTGNSGIGVHGFSNTGMGILGETDSVTMAAITARSFLGTTGVLGFSGSGPIPTAKQTTGVYGYAAQGSASRGVWGSSPAGLGVYGESSDGRGVQGVATTGIGVRAAATTGTGCHATSTTGYALVTDGRVRLDKSAGQATVGSGTSSITVTPGVDLIATSLVVATLNGDAGGSTAVKRVAINTTTNTFTIYLTANATASVKVAWLVLG